MSNITDIAKARKLCDLTEALINKATDDTGDLLLSSNALLAGAVAVAFCRGIDRASFMATVEVMWEAFEVAGRKVDRTLDS